MCERERANARALHYDTLVPLRGWRGGGQEAVSGLLRHWHWRHFCLLQTEQQVVRSLCLFFFQVPLVGPEALQLVLLRARAGQATAAAAPPRHATALIVLLGG